jgi:hypothetical protein
VNEEQIHREMANATNHLANDALRDEFLAALDRVMESYGIVFDAVSIELSFDEESNPSLNIATRILYPPAA